MTLSFSKEAGINLGNEHYNVYSLFDNERLVGKFFYGKKGCSFSFDELSVRIDTFYNSFGISKVEIVDDISHKLIGHYKLTNWIIFIGYRDKLHLQEEVHSFTKHLPDEYAIFGKINWGRYQFALTNNTEQIIYNFQIQYPSFNFREVAPTLPFEGSIEFNSNNKMAIFAGLYLIERALENLSD